MTGHILDKKTYYSVFGSLMMLLAATVVLGYGVYFLAKGRIFAGVVVAFLGAFTLLGMSAIVRRGKVGTTSLLVALPLLGLLSIALSIIDPHASPRSSSRAFGSSRSSSLRCWQTRLRVRQSTLQEKSEQSRATRCGFPG